MEPADTIAGSLMPNMTYVTPFADLAAREKGVGRVRGRRGLAQGARGVYSEGRQIVSNSTITRLRPAFSPIQ
jgi:hypothetical protein